MASKVTKIIQKIKKRIDDAIEKLILKAKKMFAELMRKLGIKDDDSEEEAKENETDEENHERYGREIIEKLKQPSEAEDTAGQYREKEEKARALENEYDLLLSDGVKTTITFESLEKVEEDDMITVDVKIAPNDMTLPNQQVPVSGKEKELVSGELLNSSSITPQSEMEITEERDGKKLVGYKAKKKESTQPFDGIIVGKSENNYGS